MTAHQRVRDALKARLSKIVAGHGGRAFTPDAVVLYSQFPDVPVVESSFRTIYGIRPVNETRQFKVPDACTVTVDAGFSVAVWRRLESADENPHASEPNRWDMQVEMASDVAQQIVEDWTLEGNALMVSGFTADFERFLDGWAVAEITFTVRYQYDWRTER